MQIHELDNFSGSLGASSYFAVDNGTDTGKLSAQQLLAATEAEIADLADSLNGRIDNIIAGGDAPSAAEIIDARHGIDGIDYASLGAAIRAQVGDVRTALLGSNITKFIKTNSSFYITAPFSFVRGTTYRIKGSANQALTFIYILSANDVGAAYRLVTIPISGNDFDILFTCQHSTGTYIAIRGANTITSITVELYIEALGGIAEQVDENENKLNAITKGESFSFTKTINDTETTGGLFYSGTNPNSQSIGEEINFYAHNDWKWFSMEIPQGTTYIDVDCVSGKDVDGLLVITDENNIVLTYSAEKPSTSMVYPFESSCYVPANAKKLYVKGRKQADSPFVISFTGIATVLRDDPESDLPAYYLQSWLEERIKTTQENAELLNGVSFPFITDIHVNANALNSKYLLETIYDNCPIYFGICGGDIPTHDGIGTDHYVDQVYIWDAYRDFLKTPLWQLRGNHDFYGFDTQTQTRGYANHAFTYNHIARIQEQIAIGEAGSSYWYYDIPTQKIRIVGCDLYDQGDSWQDTIDIGFSVKQMTWLHDVALTKNDYNYIFVMHAPIAEDLTAYTLYSSTYAKRLLNIISAMVTNGTYSNMGLTYDFTNFAGRVICTIAGHSHSDDSIVDSNGLLHIVTTCDACYNDDPGTTRTMGTVTEQAFDVFSIDLDNNTIKATRWGAGSDRTWNILT